MKYFDEMEILNADAAQGRIRGLAHRISFELEFEWNFEREAAQMRISFSHFRRKFRELNGRAPHDHLINCRLKKAMNLLRGGTLSVKEAASDSGFCDYPHFCKLFRKNFGISPGRYSKMRKPC